jgi:hypothetical protein
LTAPLTARQLNRATLARQLLLRRERLSVVEAVHRVTALQAQEAASPYLALWNRIEGFDATDLDRAFREHAIVKATLMRVTLHAVDAADYSTFHEAMQITLRAARLNDRRFTRTGMSHADADALLPEVLRYAADPRSNRRPKPGSTSASVSSRNPASGGPTASTGHSCITRPVGRGRSGPGRPTSRRASHGTPGIARWRSMDSRGAISRASDRRRPPISHSSACSTAPWHGRRSRVRPTTSSV